MKKPYIIVLALIAVALVAWFVLRNRQPKVVIFDGQAAVHNMEKNDRTVTIDEYVKRNISGLSGEAGVSETHGGIFQVTKIETHGGAGTVSYEDGHNAYTAEFTYKTDSKGLVSVTGFTVKK